MNSTIPAALLTAQKTAQGTPYVTASSDFGDKLHLVLLTASANVGGAAAASATAIVHTRYSGGNIQARRITAPATPASWPGTWNNVEASAAIEAASIKIFYTGVYFVIVWSVAASNQIRWTRSADDGVTWSASAIAYTGLAEAVFEVAAISGGAANSGIAWIPVGTTSAKIYFGLYVPGTDTWAAATSYSPTSVARAAGGLAAIWDSFNSRHVVGVLYPTLKAAHLPYTFLSRDGAGTWAVSSTYIATTSTTPILSSAALSQTKWGSGSAGLWVLTFTVEDNLGNSRFYVATSNDGLYFTNPFPISLETPYAPPILFGTDLYLALTTEVYWHTTPAYFEERTVRHYKIDLAGAVAALIADVDNRDGLINAPHRLQKFFLTRGYTISGTPSTMTTEAFYVVGYKFVDKDNFCRIKAVNQLGLMQRTTTIWTYTFRNRTVEQLIEAIAALGGLHSILTGPGAVWTDVVPIFTINPGQTCLTALISLSKRANFDVRINENGALYCYIPTTSPASQYTYGSASGQHIHWPGEFGISEAPNHLIALGKFDAVGIDDIGNDALDLAALRESGFAQINYYIDPRITALADTTELVNARKVLATELQRDGQLDAPPNFALEPGDVITINSGWAAANGPWRVEGFTEEFNGPGSRKFYQHLSLRGTA